MYTGCLNHVEGTLSFCGERWGSGRPVYCSTECYEHGLRCEGAAVVLGLIGMAEEIRKKPGLERQEEYKWFLTKGPYR